MRNLMLLFLLVVLSLNALPNSTYYVADTLPTPKIRFKAWDKLYLLPANRFEQGSELIATCEGDLECKVISYTFSCTHNGFLKEARVNSNKFDGKALQLFKQIPNDGKVYIENIKVQYSNGIVADARYLAFIKIEDDFEYIIKSAFSRNLKDEDFGVFKTNIRIKLEGNPDRSDSAIVKELVDEIKPLFESVSISLVEKSPTLVLDIQETEYFSYRDVMDTVLNPLFPKLKRKTIFLYKSIGQGQGQINPEIWGKVLKKEIIRRLATFDGYGDWRETFLFSDSYENSLKHLTPYDIELIKMLYSSKGQAELKEIRKVKPVKSADNTMLILVLSVLIFIAFSGIFSYYRFFHIHVSTKYKLINNIIQSLFIIQIPISLLLLFSTEKEYILKQLISYELSIGLIALLVTVFLTFSNNIVKNIKISGLDLIVDLILTTIFFLVGYQVLYLFYVPELIHIMDIDIQWLLIPITVVAYRSFLSYSKKRMSEIISEKELELTKQKEISLKSELLALQSRINPHFLYNALNSIASLIHIDADKTEKMTLALSKLFRYNINKDSETITSIAQEIEIVKIYLDVEIVRFSDRLKYTIDVDEDLYKDKIPVSLLQPLVENAIKHGISNLTKNGLIQIKIYQEGSWLVISVFDNGPDFPADLMTNYGLQSVFDKLSLLYKDDYKVEFINTPEKNITLKLKR